MFRASQFGARVLLFLAAAATMYTSAQQVPIQEARVPLENVAAWANVKLVHFIFGAIGAALTLTTERQDWGSVFATLFAGVVVSSVGTPLEIDMLAITKPAAENGLAAINGACGLYIVKAIKLAGRTLAANPFAVFDYFRRGGPPPAPPPPDPDAPAREGRP